LSTASPLRHHWRPSPNVEPRAGNAKPDILLLHYTGMKSAEAACAWLCDPRSRVSCHYLIDESGRITQLVDEESRAWHAGESFWQGEHDINSRSIGIEIHHPGHGHDHDFPVAQMQAVTALSRDIVRRHAIRPERVLAHSDVAPARKIDPGERFDWRMLHRAGVGHWIEPTPLDHTGAVPAIGEVQAMLARYGYGVETTGNLDAQTKTVLRAFQRHFRQARVDGLPDASTVATLSRLLAAL
jgi:N-acetylmuramoyl-L-alanine amidase